MFDAPERDRFTNDTTLADDVLERLGTEVTGPGVQGGRRGERRRERISLADRWSKPPAASELAPRGSFGLLLARPLLLIVCAIIGGAVGFGLGGHGGYKSSAILEFTIQGTDSNLAKLSGQTIAGTATSAEVIAAAAAGLGPSGAGLSDRVSAEWEQDTQLVSITVTTDSATTATTEANAVADAVVKASATSIQDQLKAALDESNQVLNSDGLQNTQAELARRTQLGTALGSRQDAIAGQSSALSVSSRATEGTVSGLTNLMTGAIGLVAGLLLAGFASLLMGIRGLRATSGRALHRLIPGIDLRTPAQAAEIAGQLVESGQKCVVVIATPGVREAAVQFTADLSFFVRALGPTVALIGPSEFDEPNSVLELLRRGHRSNVRESFGADMLVTVMAARSDASALLQGQSDLAAIVVIRRRRTPIAFALTVMDRFRRANPILILAG